MKEREIKKTKKYPFYGYSPNLIESFLIIGFDNSFKNEKALEILDNKNLNQKPKKKEEEQNTESNVKLIPTFIPGRPIVLNNISTDFHDGVLNEEEIIKNMFPNNQTPIHISFSKTGKLEPSNQNLLFYLSADRIYEEDPGESEEKQYNSNIMFNVYGYLFWECYNVQDSKVFFPQIFVFISQYSYFKLFSYLSQNIIFRIRKNINFEVPLEIQLYNIVNFTPSPIICDLQMDLLLNYDLLNIKSHNKPEIIKILKEKKEIKKEENVERKQNEINSMTLLQLSGYPYFDIDLSFLFGYFKFESLFTIYLFSFLEFKMFFFSSSLEFINTIMYITKFLSFPIMDNSDLGQIYTISKEAFLNKKEVIKNNLIGINCAYDKKIEIPEAYGNHFIISHKNDSLDLYFNGDYLYSHIINIKNDVNDSSNINYCNNIQINDNNRNIMKIIRTIENTVKESEEENENEKKCRSFLEGIILTMHQSLFQCFRNIMNNDKINNNNMMSLKTIIKELNINEGNYKNFDYQYDEYREYNENILRPFFNFNLTIFKYFHDMLNLMILNRVSSSEGNYEAIYYNIQYKREDPDNLSECDKIFFDYFEKTSKFHQFFNLFMKKNLTPELSRPSMIMTEEFINVIEALKADERKDFAQVINCFYQNKDFIQSINNFYQNSSKIGKIDFNNFYIYFRGNFGKNLFDICLNTSKVEKSILETKTITKYIYQQKGFQLDNDILRKYVYLLNDLEEKDLYLYFPSLKYILSENKLPVINSTAFADFLESTLINEKFYVIEEILVFVLLSIYIITLKNKVIIFHFFEEILKIEIKRKLILRKYIYLILLIINDLIKEKISKQENYINELLLYKEIMNCIYTNTKKCYYPNEGLSTLVENFIVHQMKYEELLKQKKYSEENKKIIAKYNSDERDIPEEGVSYIVILKDNACKDKGPIKDEALISTIETLGYLGSIQYTCKTCQTKIKPDLFFVLVPIDKSGNTGFLSLSCSYKNITNLLKNILAGKVTDQKKIEKELFDIIGNLIFYLNYKKGRNNIISGYLASCLR